jgi:hypothetical protein
VLAEGPDFTEHHCGSEFRDPPMVARILFVIERKSWVVWKKGKHGGTLGRSALFGGFFDQLRANLRSYGRLDDCVRFVKDCISAKRDD